MLFEAVRFNTSDLPRGNAPVFGAFLVGGTEDAKEVADRNGCLGGAPLRRGHLLPLRDGVKLLGRNSLEALAFANDAGVQFQLFVTPPVSDPQVQAVKTVRHSFFDGGGVHHPLFPER